MEQAEELVDDLRIQLEQRMRLYLASHLNSVTMDQHTRVIENTQQILESLTKAITKLVKKFSPHLGEEKVRALNAEILQFEEKFVVYRESFVPILADLKKAHSMNNAVSSVVPSMNNLALSKSSQNTAIKKVKAKLEDIREDLDKLSNKATKVDDWSNATDLAVERAMRENEKLRNEFDRINAARRDVKELMAEFDLEEARDGLSVQECDLRLLDVEEEVENTIKAVEEQNDVRELYSLDEVKVDKIKLPTFSGMDSEDYVESNVYQRYSYRDRFSMQFQ